MRCRGIMKTKWWVFLGISLSIGRFALDFCLPVLGNLRNYIVRFHHKRSNGNQVLCGILVACKKNISWGDCHV
jgi:hypothetical protein